MTQTEYAAQFQLSHDSHIVTCSLVANCTISCLYVQCSHEVNGKQLTGGEGAWVIDKIQHVDQLRDEMSNAVLAGSKAASFLHKHFFQQVGMHLDL